MRAQRPQAYAHSCTFMFMFMYQASRFFFHFLYIHISTASNLLLSVCINVHTSAAYSAALQTKHFSKE